MSVERKLWSSTLVAGLGLLFSPFASIVLQAMNYGAVGKKREVRASACWFVGLFLTDVAWGQLPLPLSPPDRLAAGIAFGFALFFVWFVFYGRKYRRTIGEDILSTAPVRSAFLAFGIAIAVWITVIAATVLVALAIGRLTRHI